MADTARISGALGTVEEGYKYQGGRSYRKSSPPKSIGETSITGHRPKRTDRDIARLRTIRERETVTPKKVKGGGSALWVEFLGYARGNDVYGIRIKVRGMAATDQWLPFHRASATWYEITGTDFAEVVS